MAVHCPFCKSFDLGACFDTYQCYSCGGHCNMDGTPTVPTSALDAGATYSGPGHELLDDPDNPPFQAKDPVK